ncbi:nitrate reductase, partial [Streptomyces sp. NPDC001848]
MPSACVLCSNGCGLDIAVAGDRIVGVRGRAGDRVDHGRLGPEGLFGWQANNSGDRLTTPLAPGTRWPERVDQYLTVDEERVERWVPSACVLC